MTLEKRDPTPSAIALYAAELRKSPLRIGGIVIEYLMFAAGLFLALCLFVTRVPLRVVDRSTGLRLRERFVDLLAKISPG